MPQRKVSKRPDGRYRSRHDDLTLLEIVASAAAEARPDDPLGLAQAEFDDTREAVGEPDAPAGGGIARRLGLPWFKVVALAHLPIEDQAHQLGLAQMARKRTNISLPRCLRSMALAAGYLKVSELDRGRYAQAQRQIGARSRRAWKHGSPTAGEIPRVTQIDVVLRRHGLRWEQAVELAGLTPRTDNSARGLSLEQAVEDFVATTGTIPRERKQMWVWGKARGVSISVFTAKDLRGVLDALAASRAEQGLPPLERAAVGEQFGDVERAPLTAAPPRRILWNDDRDKIIRGMAIGVLCLEPGQRLTQQTLKAVARDNKDLPIPSWNVVDGALRRRRANGDETATWELWRREALKIAYNEDFALLAGEQLTT